MRLFSSMPRTVAAGLVPVAAAVALGQGGAFGSIEHSVFGSHSHLDRRRQHATHDMGRNGVWTIHGKPVLVHPKATVSPTVSATPTPSAEPTVEPTSVAPTVVPTSASPTASSTGDSGLPWAPLGSIFGLSSVWRADIASAPVSSNSAAMVAGLTNEVTSLYNGVAAFNVDQYGTNFYTVPAGTATTNVAYYNCQNKDYTPTGLTGPGGQFTDIPIPADAVSAAGTDGEMTIYQPSSNSLWELWVAQKTSSGWQACWGGHMTDVSDNPGYFTGNFGATATGLPVAGGMVSIQDVQAGVINHAISLEIPDAAVWNDFSYPAQRSDGGDTASNAIPEGTRLRLPASVDVDALNLSPIARIVAHAAQTYGFIVTDSSGAVSIPAESGTPMQAATGTDPWAALMGSTPAYNIFNNFPWAQLQALPQNWGQ